MNEFIDTVVNPSTQASVTQLRSPLRRRMLIGSAVAALFSTAPTVHAATQSSLPFGFSPVPIVQAGDTDDGSPWRVIRMQPQPTLKATCAAISSWPDAGTFKRPSSPTIAVWREDDGAVGS